MLTSSPGPAPPNTNQAKTMQIIEVLKAFAYSDDGFTVQNHAAGDISEVSDACAAEEAAMGNAKVLTADDLAKARAAHSRLQAAADKAEQAAAKAEATAADLRAKADSARARAGAARISRQAEDEAAELPPDAADDPAPQGDLLLAAETADEPGTITAGSYPAAGPAASPAAA